MLDFQKLIPQIVALAQHSLPVNNQEKQILSLAQTGFEEASSSWQQLENRLKKNLPATFWPVALPLEPFGQSHTLSPYSKIHSLVACDGSQIMPTQHEVHSCFLLNVGAAVFHYSQKSRAQLLSFPHLYYRHEDLYPLINQRRIHVDESLVSFERNLMELEQALHLARAEQDEGHKVLTLVDGSLIPFNVDRQPERFQQELLQRFETRLAGFREAGLPVLGYISHSRSSDIVNILRVWRCPYPESRCHIYCQSINEEDFPCSKIWPLSDRQLLSSKLPLRSRSNFFLSGARWSNLLSEQNQICFAYLNIGHESCRLEIPRWLFAGKDLLEFALAALLLQVQKGQGYPLGLAEAHNMAVIRQADRSRFYEVVTAELLKARLVDIKVSPKESKKRRGIV